MKPHLSTQNNDNGFILPLVLIISLIISTGLMALAARSWLGLNGSIRQSQSRQAREIAEAGLARLIESLNSDYSYLLIKTWATGAISPTPPRSALIRRSDHPAPQERLAATVVTPWWITTSRAALSMAAKR